MQNSPLARQKYRELGTETLPHSPIEYSGSHRTIVGILSFRCCRSDSLGNRSRHPYFGHKNQESRRFLCIVREMTPICNAVSVQDNVNRLHIFMLTGLLADAHPSCHSPHLRHVWPESSHSRLYVRSRQDGLLDSPSTSLCRRRR